MVLILVIATVCIDFLNKLNKLTKTRYIACNGQ